MFIHRHLLIMQFKSIGEVVFNTLNNAHHFRVIKQSDN